MRTKVIKIIVLILLGMSQISNANAMTSSKKKLTAKCEPNLSVDGDVLKSIDDISCIVDKMPSPSPDLKDKILGKGNGKTVFLSKDKKTAYYKIEIPPHLAPSAEFESEEPATTVSLSSSKFSIKLKVETEGISARSKGESYKAKERQYHELKLYKYFKDSNIHGVVQSVGIDETNKEINGEITHKIEYFENGVLESQLQEHYLESNRDQKNRFKPEEIYQIAKNTCSTLTAMHHAGCYHKDIKPGNIFIRSFGPPMETVLGDFDQSFCIRDDLEEEGKTGFNPSLTTAAFIYPGFDSVAQSFIRHENKVKENLKVFTDLDHFEFGATILSLIFNTRRPPWIGIERHPSFYLKSLTPVKMDEFIKEGLTRFQEAGANSEQVDSLRNLLSCSLGLTSVETEAVDKIKVNKVHCDNFDHLCESLGK